MGAGANPAGYGLAGSDVPTTERASKLFQGDPLRYDPLSRQFPIDLDTGLQETIHWVDQVVVLALTITNGSHASNTTLGNRLRQIARAAGPTLQAEVEDAVSEALRASLDRGDILINGIEVKTPVRGQILVYVWYINVRNDSERRPRVADRKTTSRPSVVPIAIR